MFLNIHDLVRIELVDEPKDVTQYFRMRLGYFARHQSEGEPDIVVRFVDRIDLDKDMSLAGDKDKLTVAYNKECFCILTLPTTKVGGFSGYAQANASRYHLNDLPDRTIGSDFTQEPNSRNPKPELLKNCGKQMLSLFRFCHLTLTHLVKMIALFKRKVKPDSSPALKYGVSSGVFINYGGKVSIHIGGFTSYKFHLLCEYSVNVSQLFDLLMMFLIQPILLHKGATLTHASAVSVDGKGVLTTGWRDIGKTSLMMRFLKDGAGYMADDLAIIYKDRVLSLPMPLNLTMKHLSEFDLQKKVARSFFIKRAMRKIAYCLGRCLQRCPSVSLYGVGSVFTQLGDTKSLTTQINALNLGLRTWRARDAPLSKVFFLTRTLGDKITVSKVDVGSLANMMMKPLVYEMDMQCPEVYHIFRFAFPSMGQKWIDNREREMREVLIKSLQSVDVDVVDLPYEHAPNRLYDVVKGLV